MSTFSGLEIGNRALHAHQKALEVTSHNLSNAGTPGYSRQIVDISATDPYTYPSFVGGKVSGQIGTGVEIKAVLRVRDALIDEQIRKENGLLGHWEGMRDTLNQMEMILNEPSDAGLRDSMDQFWISLEELSTHPQEEATRSAVRQQAITFTEQINHSYEQLNELRGNLNEQVKTQVSDINKYTSQIAELNDQIVKVLSMGEHPNDLLDQRDDLQEKLSKIVNVTSFVDKVGQLNLSIGGRALVVAANHYELSTERNDEDYGMVKILWGETAIQIEPTSGILKGLFNVRDQSLPELMNNLDVYSQSIVEQMNEVHAQGYGLDGSTGNDFFTGTNAQNISVSETVLSDLNKIAASATGAPGNGETALELANLKQQKLLVGNGANMGDFIGSLVAKLGIESGVAKTKCDNQTLLINHLNSRRESISGVSIDEELTNMMKYQHGYNAAAKVITTVDEMLEVVINGLKR